MDWKICYNLIKSKVNNSGDYIVLCTRRSVFIDDVKAMSELSGKIQYIIIGRIYFKMILDWGMNSSQEAIANNR